jgi:thiol:disulfide interchange protein DsbD
MMMRVVSMRATLSVLVGVALSANAASVPAAPNDAQPTSRWWEQELRQWNQQLTNASVVSPAAATPVSLAASTDATWQPGSSQSETLRWTVQVTPTHPQPGDTVELVFTADIASGWILYSSDFSADIGPRPARFSFEPTPGLALIDHVRPVNSLRRKDKTLKVEYSYFERRAEFRQKAKLTAPVKTIAGRIDGQTCAEESGLCQLFQKTFTANLD